MLARGGLRYRLAGCLALAVGAAMAAAPALAAERTKLRLAQTQAQSSCILNCDTKSGTCQSACTVPTVSAVAPFTGTRQDPGATTQCMLTCATQALTCKQACPH
jgi:hypothetical protein